MFLNREFDLCMLRTKILQSEKTCQTSLVMLRNYILKVVLCFVQIGTENNHDCVESSSEDLENNFRTVYLLSNWFIRFFSKLVCLVCFILPLPCKSSMMALWDGPQHKQFCCATCFKVGRRHFREMNTFLTVEYSVCVLVVQSSVTTEPFCRSTDLLRLLITLCLLSASLCWSFCLSLRF